MKIVVKRTGRTWGVFVDGKLVEGGFFSKDAADAAADDRKKPVAIDPASR